MSRDWLEVGIAGNPAKTKQSTCKWKKKQEGAAAPIDRSENGIYTAEWDANHCMEIKARMTGKNDKPQAGWIMTVLSTLGGCYLIHFLWKALATGTAPGKFGAVHYAWSTSYTISVLAAGLGIVFSIGLIVLGVRYARGRE